MEIKKLRGEFVLIEPAIESEVTASGIIVKKTKEQGDFFHGVIKAIGTGKVVGGNIVPIDLEIGDKVLYTFGAEIKVGDNSFLLVNEADVKLVFN